MAYFPQDVQEVPRCDLESLVVQTFFHLSCHCIRNRKCSAPTIHTSEAKVVRFGLKETCVQSSNTALRTQHVWNHQRKLPLSLSGHPILHIITIKIAIVISVPIKLHRKIWNMTS